MNKSLGFIGGLLLFASSPSSTNYILKSYDYGAGGSDTTSSTNYRLNSDVGQTAGSLGSSTNYKLNSGELPTQLTNVPLAPTVSNPSNYYDRLKIILDTGSNPSDTTYLLAISDDGFATTKYVQTDNSIGASYTISNYQTYSVWGGASGFFVLGLNPSSTYSVKVRALQGRFSESAFSPISSALTVATTISFSVTTTLTSTPPFPVSFASLLPNVVTVPDADVSIALSTNALSGGSVVVGGSSAGLVSASAGYTIPSTTTDLSAAVRGYGAQVTAVSQSSGGPFVSASPFNGTTDNVGGLTSSLQRILSSAGQINAGSSTVRLKAKADSTVPSASDYTDTLTFIASMTF